MTDAGKKALEELVAGIGRCEHDGGFDREIGPIGCMLGDKCVCAGAYPMASKAIEEFAILEARATAAEERARTIKDRAQFLIDRLDELELDDDTDDLLRDWNGHVEPALSRLRAALAGDKP